ncbi:MAG: phosphoribosylglycinamide formyltransferase [Bacteroidetes bacterium]|nr:phosphoribosylglycinamide formyltransferase [Bacteroidota bacterium]
MDVIKRRIAIFASGSGSNAENIINYANVHQWPVTFFIYTENKNAGVIERALRLNVVCKLFSMDDFKRDALLSELRELKIDLIVLAGFLKLMPDHFITTFKQRIVNIHPALLPKYGGKGMYGMHVHKAVKAHNETETGITIHFVNAQYDEGEIIMQEKIGIDADDSPEQIAAKVHQLEYKYYPKAISKILKFD